MKDNCIKEITLKNDLITLIPLDISHKDDLLKAVEDGELYKLWFTGIPSKKNVDEYINKAIDDKNNCKSYAFIVYHNIDKKIIGSTRYLNIDLVNKRLEIGNTWYSKSYQRSAVNTNCKLLLLSYAFEEFDAIAVEFRTHWHNHKSRNAIARLGAKQDGVLRNHTIDKDGGYRDTVVFSIINLEWKIVKKSLLYNIKRNYNITTRNIIN
jgi:RimJ/RimL family protein N-acetyltransferase